MPSQSLTLINLKPHLKPHLLAVAAALAASAAYADTQSDLKSALAGFGGSDPVRASVDYEFWSRSGDKDGMAEENCIVAVRVEEDAEGLRIVWSRDTIHAAGEEVQAASANAESKTPMRRAMGALSATVLSGYLNGTAELLRALGQSELVNESAAGWKGRPARLLTFKMTPRVNAQTKKYLKELDATLKVWVGEGGVPLAAERNIRIKGRAFLVVSFESTESDEYEFVASGDRLVVTRHLRQSSGTGTGGSNSQRTLATLILARD